MKALLIAAAVAAVPLPTEKPTRCPTENTIRKAGTVKNILPFRSDGGEYFIIGVVKNTPIILRRNEKGRYCDGMTITKEAYGKLVQRYFSYEI